jgi:hypothetical protein
MRTIFVGGPLHLRQLDLKSSPYAISLNKPSFTLKKRNGIIFTAVEHELFDSGGLPVETSILYILNAPIFIKRYGQKKLSKYDEYIIAASIYEKCSSNPSLRKKLRHDADGWEEIKTPLAEEELKEMSLKKVIYHYRNRDVLRSRPTVFYTIYYYSCLSKNTDVKYDSELINLHFGA